MAKKVIEETETPVDPIKHTPEEIAALAALAGEIIASDAVDSKPDDNSETPVDPKPKSELPAVQPVAEIPVELTPEQAKKAQIQQAAVEWYDREETAYKARMEAAKLVEIAEEEAAAKEKADAIAAAQSETPAE